MALTLESVRTAMTDLRAAGGKVGVREISEITGGNKAKIAEYRRAVLEEWERAAKAPPPSERSKVQSAIAYLRELFGEIEPIDELLEPEKALEAALQRAYDARRDVEEQLAAAERRISKLERHKVTWKDHSTLVVELNQAAPHTEGPGIYVEPERATLTVYLDEEFGTPHTREWRENCHILSEVVNIEAVKNLTRHLKEHPTYRNDYALQLLVDRMTKPHRS